MEYFLALHSQVYTFIYHIKKQSKFYLGEIINYLLGENTDICQKNLFQIIHVLLKQHPVQSYLQNSRIYFIRNFAMQQLFTGNLFKMDLKVAVMKIQCFPHGIWYNHQLLFSQRTSTYKMSSGKTILQRRNSPGGSHNM